MMKVQFISALILAILGAGCLLAALIQADVSLVVVGVVLYGAGAVIAYLSIIPRIPPDGL